MKTIRFTVIVVAALMAVLAVFAQEATLGLSPDDYSLFSTANSTAMNSFAFDYSGKVVVDGLDTFAVNSSINGMGAVDNEAHALDVALNGSVLLGTKQQITPQAEMHWLDGTLYLNPGDGWQVRSDAAQFASDLIGQIMTLYADPSALEKWDLAGIDGWGDMTDALKAIPASAFISAERLDDASVGDVQAAHFQIGIDLHAMMDTDEFVNLVTAFSIAQGSALNIIYKHDQLADIVRANNALFEGTTLMVDQYIGLDDSLIHRVTAALNMPLEPTRLGYVDPPFTASADLDITFSKINETQAIAAPGGAEVVDAFTLLTPAPLDAVTAGTNEYVFFETVGDGETFTQPFEAQAGDHVTVTVRGLGYDFDTYASLLDADGNSLVENEDREAEVFGLGPCDSQIADFAIPESGTYSAAVKESTGAGGSFELTITIKR